MIEKLACVQHGFASDGSDPPLPPHMLPPLPSRGREQIPKLAFQHLASAQSSAPLTRRNSIESLPIGNEFENPLASISRDERDFGIPPTQRLRFSAGTFRSWLFRMLVRNACAECQVKSATCGGFEVPCHRRSSSSFGTSGLELWIFRPDVPDQVHPV
jgi:hypothetical protein